MKWFQIKEQSAGEKRLLLSYYLYKIFGKKVLYLIAFLVSFFTFLFAPKVRSYSKKYFMAAYDFIKIKPTLLNQFKHILSYANSLADKFLVYNGDFDSKVLIFENKEDEVKIQEDLDNKKGIFFICNHIGNIELFQSYLLTREFDFSINIFMSKLQSQIFNGFLSKVGVKYPCIFFPVEEIGLNSGIELKENIDKGGVVFIAGDRLAQNNDKKNIKEKMFEKDITLPRGTFKLAKFLEVPTYFISVIQIGKSYKIILEKQEDLTEAKLANNFTKYMERVIKINPFQFFHFYDFFN